MPIPQTNKVLSWHMREILIAKLNESDKNEVSEANGVSISQINHLLYGSVIVTADLVKCVRDLCSKAFQQF